MEANKENENRFIPQTRIPLPMEPLPALPRHLLKEINFKAFENSRQPLKTINSQSMPGQSNQSKSFNPMVPGHSRGKIAPNKPKSPTNFDSKHVTTRQGNDDLDWNYNIFKDERNNSVISVSDEENDNENLKELRYFVENRTKNCFEDARMAITPVVKSSTLEAGGVRNIKRSLKRPHSRELQGLSPMEKQERKAEERVKRRLHFNERLQERLQSPDYLKKCYMKCMTRDYTTDMFNYLICAETKPLEVPRTSSITRACVINWLIKVNGSDGNPAIIHTACWYLDSILGTSQVQLDKLQLVAAACYWIAQKLHGPVLTATRLVKCANHAFSASRLMAAEKVVLQKLKFPTQPVVPQEFITYLSWWCDNNHPGEIEVAATFLCMSGLMVDKALCEEYPSAIAAASVRNALLLLRKRDLMMRLAMCPVYKSAEKKTTNMSYVCSILRRAVRTIAAPIYEYKAPFDHYGIPPNYIAQRIINAANDLAVIDTRVISNDQSTLLTSLYNN